MVENLETVISKGIHTWKNNLNICIPLIINQITKFFIVVFALVIAFFIFGIDMSDETLLMNDDEILNYFTQLVMENLPALIVLGILVLLIIFLVDAYFLAGAVGMSRSAISSGDTTLADMFHAGGKNFINVFLANLLIMLIELAGIVFIVPGAILMRNTMDLPESDQFLAGLLIFILGLIVWFAYILVIAVVLAVVIYSIVIEGIGAMDGIMEGYRFFMENKLTVFSLVVIVMIISGIIGFFSYLIGNITMLLGSETLYYAWSMLYQLFVLTVISPIIMIWWTRLYMVRTGKPLYIDELLTDPWGKEYLSGRH